MLEENLQLLHIQGAFKSPPQTQQGTQLKAKHCNRTSSSCSPLLLFCFSCSLLVLFFFFFFLPDEHHQNNCCQSENYTHLIWFMKMMLSFTSMDSWRRLKDDVVELLWTLNIATSFTTITRVCILELESLLCSTSSGCQGIGEEFNDSGMGVLVAARGHLVSIQ